GGNAPGNAPTSTAIGDFGFNGVYTNAYKKIENTDNSPVKKLSCTKINVPPIPISKPNTSACPVVIRPVGNGLSIVRRINLSMSRSMISLNVFAAPVTKKPPIVNNNQLNHIMSPCCFAPIKNDIDAENTTVKVNRNFTSLLKSEIKALINNSSPNQHRCRLAVQCRMFHILTALHVS